MGGVPPLLDRRVFLGAALAASAAGRARGAASSSVSGDDILLRIERVTMDVDGRRMHAIGINGAAPGPTIRLREGRRVRIRVENALDEETSLHWHGLLVPARYDGVPGVSFAGIAPGETLTYEFDVRQSGTYWYHSHSGLQEQAGLYGAIVIDPAGGEAHRHDREHVVMLSDHAFASPEAVFRRMKVQPGYYNFQKQTLAGLLAGRDQPLRDRLRWGAMRMDPADVADGTGATYTYLVNGFGPRSNWTGAFRPGERVRLRIVNASSMTTFDVRIPGLTLTVVAADGLDVRPVEVGELQIGVAETYDVIVTPGDRAYALVAEGVDRANMARATLAPRPGMVADVPALRPRPLATMTDMGMGGMDMAGMGAMHGGGHAMPGHEMPGHDMSGDGGDMAMRSFANAPGVAHGPGVQTISPMPEDRTGYPGQGMADVGHRVLTYRDLESLAPNPDVRAPSRAIDVHLTGNMERFMWSIDGDKMSDHMTPIPFTLGERVRVRLVNDTMMAHPIHLHGHFFELVTGKGAHAPRKHTVICQPGGTVSFDLTADNPGDWAFHCHMLYHMASGMMRVVSVRPGPAAT